VIRYDHRGCGRSDAPRTDYSIRQMTDDARAVLDGLGLDRAAAVIGHSTGGAIAQTLALDHGERVGAVVLSATWAGPDPYMQALFHLRRHVLATAGATAYQQLGTLMLKPPAWLSAHPEALAVEPEDATRRVGDPVVLARRIDAILAHDRRADLPRLRHPVLVVCARDDAVTPVNLSHELAERLPNAKLEMLDGGGHYVPEIAPQAWLAVVLPFLDRHVPTGDSA
jgi:aminoacrylate hydrolase